MNAVCLIVAGVVHATLPATEFSLQWTHSVQKVRWEERYRVDGAALRLVEARAQGSGAGLEIPTDAQRRGDGWSWHPERRLDALTLAHSAFGGDYRLCAGDSCETLSERVAPSSDAPLTLSACDARALEGTAGAFTPPR
jgi:hypothetical protein